MKTYNANDLRLLADEIKRRTILTQYLTPAKKRCYVCIGCGNGSGKDFFEVVKFGCQEFGLPCIETDESPTTPTDTKKAEKVEPFGRLEEAQKNLADFVKKQGGKWRGLTLETLQHIKAGFLPNVYFPADKKEIPAVVIPNDLGGVYFRSIQGKFHKNNKPMATTTIFLPDTEEFDLFVTEGQINALSIFQAVPNPNFGIMACSGTSGENNILAKLKVLETQGKKFRVILAFDFDSNNAGQNAAVNTLNSLIIAISININNDKQSKIS